MLNLGKKGMFDHKYTFRSEEWALDELRQFVTEFSHLSYAICMRDSVGNLSIHRRVDLPCYGELRKYLNTHPKDQVTKNYPPKKPTDLHYPFPDGTPEALAVLFYTTVPDEVTLEYLVSKDSPFRRGYQIDQVEFIKGDGGTKGMVLKDTEFDPTVLVNMLKRTQQSYVLPKILDLGFTKDEAYILNTMLEFSWTSYQGEDHIYIIPYESYIQSPTADLLRIVTGRSVDLTGGTFKQRFDYERKDMHCIFKPPADEKFKGFNLFKEFPHRLPRYYSGIVIPTDRFSEYKSMISDTISKGIEVAAREIGPEVEKAA